MRTIDLKRHSLPTRIAAGAVLALLISICTAASVLAAPVSKARHAGSGHRRHAHKSRRVHRRRRTHRKHHVREGHRPVGKRNAHAKSGPGSSSSTPVATPPASSSGIPVNDPFATSLSTGSPGAVDPSGQPMPVGNIPGWTQVFADDFTTDVTYGGFSGCHWYGTLMSSTCTGLPPSVASQLWAYPDGSPDTMGNGEYMPSQVLTIDNGTLNYNIHTANGIHEVAAVLPKIPGGVNNTGLQNGAYVIRFRADPLYGYKTAFMLWPDNYPNGQATYPSLGEVDFPEGDLDSNIWAFMHWMNATAPHQQDYYETKATYPDWHTAVIEKTGTYDRFILDGVVVGTSTAHLPTDPMHWILQVETAVDGKVPPDSTSGYLQVDWIAAYKPS